MNKKLITIIAGAVALIIIVFAVATGTSSKTSVKVSDYVELTLSGYSGYTSVPSDITQFLNTESLENEIISKDGTVENWQFTSGGYLYHEEVMTVEVEETEKGYLSNGDTVKYTITINKDRFEALTGLKLKGKNEIKGKYKVSGLEEPELIDVFGNIEITFDGDNGNGSMRIKKISDDELIKSINIDVSENYKDYDLSNGDKVEVTAYCNAYIVSKYGKAPKETSMMVTVSGLTEYATIDDISKDLFIEYAKKFAAEYQKSNDEDPNFTYTDVEIAGIYFAESTDGEKAENGVHIIVGYTGNYGISVDSRYHIKYYDNLALNDNGKLDISYEDGRGDYFFYDSAESYLDSLTEEYKLTKIN